METFSGAGLKPAEVFLGCVCLPRDGEQSVYSDHRVLTPPRSLFLSVCCPVIRGFRGEEELYDSAETSVRRRWVWVCVCVCGTVQPQCDAPQTSSLPGFNGDWRPASVTRDVWCLSHQQCRRKAAAGAKSPMPLLQSESSTSFILEEVSRFCLLELTSRCLPQSAVRP